MIELSLRLTDQQCRSDWGGIENNHPFNTSRRERRITVTRRNPMGYALTSGDFRMRNITAKTPAQSFKK